MNMFKKNGGFTLVELIVVIAILAILAGVAVPAYTGYIKKAQQTADMQVLSSINTAVQGLAVAQGEKVEAITVTKTDTAPNYTVTIDTDATTSKVTAAEVYALTDTVSFNEKFTSATWAMVDGAGKWTATYTNK